MDELADKFRVLRMNIRLSRGKWHRIAVESGCRWNTLTSIANDVDYDPKFSEVARIDAWFRENGGESGVAQVAAAPVQGPN
jgi:hypothetical protein